MLYLLNWLHKHSIFRKIWEWILQLPGMTENVSRIGKTHQESLEDLSSRREPWSGSHSMSSTTILNFGLNHMFSNLTDSWKRMFITSNLFLGFLLALVPDNASVNVSKCSIFRQIFFPLIVNSRRKICNDGNEDCNC